MVTEISKSIIEKDGKYLLLKRALHSKSFPGLWDFAGGKHDLEETSEEAIVRETKEETSFDIQPGPEIKTASYKDDQYDLLFHYFTPEIISGKLTLSPDHSEYKWVKKEELKNLKLHPSVKLYFNN